MRIDSETSPRWLMMRRQGLIIGVAFVCAVLLCAVPVSSQIADSLPALPPLVSDSLPRRFDPRADMIRVDGRDIAWTLPDAAGRPRKAEKTVRRVESFLMDRTEVTNQQFAQFLSASDSNVVFYDPRMDIVQTASAPYRARAGRENFPVAWVDWTGAFAFARWAGKRLPTEDEWTAAALSGRSASADSLIYPWEGAPDSARCNSLVAKGIPAVAEAGSHPAGFTSSGIADLAGNVAEWTLTEVTSDLPGGGKQSWVVVKGGSYLDPPQNLSLFSRGLHDRSERLSSLGFRCVLREPLSH